MLEFKQSGVAGKLSIKKQEEEEKATQEEEERTRSGESETKIRK